MKTILGLSATVLFTAALLLMLGSDNPSVGQGSSQPLWLSDEVADPSCTLEGWPCGSPYSGCVSIMITLPSDGRYKLHVWMDCNPSQQNCGQCFACAHLVRLSDNLDIFTDGVHTDDNCDGASCDVQTEGLQLTAGDYKLLICKRPCNTSTCQFCSTSCAAHAQVIG